MRFKEYKGKGINNQIIYRRKYHYYMSLLVKDLYLFDKKRELVISVVENSKEDINLLRSSLLIVLR